MEEELQQEIDELKAEIGGLESEIHDLEVEVREITDEKNELESERDDLVEENWTLREFKAMDERYYNEPKSAYEAMVIDEFFAHLPNISLEDIIKII